MDVQANNETVDSIPEKGVLRKTENANGKETCEKVVNLISNQGNTPQ